MGLRRHRRQIAKTRLEIMGVGNVNKKLHLRKDGLPYWKAALTGETGKAAEKAQMAWGNIHLSKGKSKNQIKRERMAERERRKEAANGN